MSETATSAAPVKATMAGMHCFEAAGLGKAPFRYIGMVDQEIAHGKRVISSVGGCQTTTQAGGTCDYCSRFIINMFNIESADGKRFHVGCDCLAKVGEAGMKLKADKAIRVLAKIRKARREAERVDAAKSRLPAVCGRLAEQPHPNSYRAGQGETLLDWVRWVLANTGGMAAARVIEKQ